MEGNLSIFTPADLAHAIKNGAESIEIEGDLARKVVRIKATGKVAWVIAFGAIAVVIGSLVMTAGSGGTTAPVGVPASALGFSAVTAVLGSGAATAAIGVAVAAGGVGALTRLYSGYKIVEKTSNRVILRKV